YTTRQLVSTDRTTSWVLPTVGSPEPMSMNCVTPRALRLRLVEVRAPVAGHTARRAGHRLVGRMVLGRGQFRAAAVHPILRVAPEPRLARLEAPDQRVPGGGGMVAGVLGRRGVAAA